MNDVKNSIALLIPAYQPDERLIELVNELCAQGFARIFIVNDGSDDRVVFERISKIDGVTIVNHEKNLGKGAALKTGFRFILDHCADVNTIVTADADGQHLPEDVCRIADAAIAAPESFVLGARKFDERVPLRSFLGNMLTRGVLRWTENINLQDTQTGLRAWPVALAKEALILQSSRYDFELQSIVLAAKKNTPIFEVPIACVYIDDNKSSHFRPLFDSMRVYAVFARFLAVSIASFLLDITLFAAFLTLNQNIFASTYIARTFSSAFNFFGNKYVAFKAYERRRLIREVISYLALVIFIAVVSAAAVNAIAAKTGDAVLVKVFVDTGLFFLNFVVQKVLIFQRKYPT